MRTKWVRRDDRGTVLIIVAAFMIVAVVMTAAVIDLGGQREQRKELTLSTDSAALAAAGLADTEDATLTAAAAGTLIDCDEVDIAPEAPQFERDKYAHVQEVVDYFLEENGESQPVECKVARTGFRTGYVVVSANEIVEYKFAPAFGQSAGGVSGASVAAIEVDPGGGLRPVGICGAMEGMAGVDGYPEISLNDLWNSTSASPVAGYTLDADGYVIDSAGVRNPFTARYPIEKVKGGSCGSTSGGGSGNFGKLDFGGGTSTSCDNTGHFCKDYADGYYGTLTDPTNGDTGNNWSNNETDESTENLEQNVGQFWAPVYDSVSGTGGNADFTLTYFVQLEMVNHCFSGSCKFGDTTWFDFRVSRMISFVPAGPPVTDDANLQPQRLCAMENDAAAIAAGCPQFAATTSTLPPSSSTTAPSDCSAELATFSPSPQIQGASGNLKNDLGVKVAVADAAQCTGFSVRIVRVSDGARLDADTCCTQTGDEFDGLFKKNPSGWSWSTGAHQLEAFVGATVVGTFDFSVSS